MSSRARAAVPGRDSGFLRNRPLLVVHGIINATNSGNRFIVRPDEVSIPSGYHCLPGASGRRSSATAARTACRRLRTTPCGSRLDAPSEPPSPEPLAPGPGLRDRRGSDQRPAGAGDMAKSHAPQGTGAGRDGLGLTDAKSCYAPKRADETVRATRRYWPRAAIGRAPDGQEAVHPRRGHESAGEDAEHGSISDAGVSLANI